jgi:hypothetical protein
LAKQDVDPLWTIQHIAVHPIFILLLGGFMWCGALFFYEYEQPRWLRYSLVFGCSLATVIIVQFAICLLLKGA